LALDEQATKYRSLDDWFKTPQGMRASIAFATELGQISEHLHGEKLLQLGSCGDNVWLSFLRYRHKWVATPYFDSQTPTLVTSLNSLPIERDSIDCIIAPLTFEAFARDKNPIDEIDRVLKPMGYVVFFGINPLSFWGFSLRWGHLGCFGSASSTLTPSFSVKQAMLNRDFRQCSHSSFYYIPPFKNYALIQKMEFLNEVGKMVCPFPAGFYCFIVQKYQYCQPSLVGRVAEGDILLQSSIPMKI